MFADFYFCVSGAADKRYSLCVTEDMGIDYRRLHAHCGWHEEAIKSSDKCGCFYCMNIFSSKDIVDWVEESESCPRGPGKTAICPKCSIDAVLPDSIGYEITPTLLKAMNEKYF